MHEYNCGNNIQFFKLVFYCYFHCYSQIFVFKTYYRVGQKNSEVEEKMVPYQRLDSAFQNDRCIFLFYHSILQISLHSESPCVWPGLIVPFLWLHSNSRPKITVQVECTDRVVFNIVAPTCISKEEVKKLFI